MKLFQLILITFLIKTSAYGQAMFASYQGVNYVSATITTGMKVRYEISNINSYSGSGSTITDLIGNANGTIYNNPSYSSDGTNFTMVGANSNYILTDNIGASDVESVFMWIFPTADGVILSELGQSSINSGSHNSQIEISGNTIRYSIWPYTVNANSSSEFISGNIGLNSWHYVGFTYDGTSLTGYLDGASIGTIAVTRQAPTDLYYGIGAMDGNSTLVSGGGAYGNFKLGAFHYYNRSLTSNEVNVNFKSQAYNYALKTCKDIAGTNSPSGVYYIDPDGKTGPNIPYKAYCDNSMDGGGWTLVAIRASSGINQIFNETIISPLLTSSSVGRVSSTDWSANSSFPFTQIKFTNANNESATATFNSTTSISSLNASNTTYTSVATSATVTSTDSRLVKFYWRAKSGNYSPFDDSADWAYWAFGEATLNSNDGWDTGRPYWILAGVDNTYDPSTYNGNGSTNSGVVVGKTTIGNFAGRHWWGSDTVVFQLTGSVSTDKFISKTFVWLK